MPLTPVQRTTLVTDILADPVLVTYPQTADGGFAVAAAYNLVASPDYWIWRTAVSKSELVTMTSIDSTTFNWSGNGFITRSVGEQTAWRELFGENGVVNAALPQVRQAFLDIFSGSGIAAANRAHLSTMARRKALRAEKLFASGTGSTASPAILSFEGMLSYQDILSAWGV